MKNILSSKKKIILISTIALIVILTGCLVLPQAIGSKEDGGELFETGSFIEETKGNEISAETQNADETISAKENNENKNLETSSKAEITGPAKVLSKTISGKNLNFEYIKTEKTDYTTYDDNVLYVYKNKDETEIKIDGKTGEIRSIIFNGLSTDVKKAEITEEKAIQIAKDFAKEYCDISKYSKCKVFTSLSNYIISFSKEICGIGTTDGVVVVVDNNAKVYSYSKTPDVFKGFDTSKFSIKESDIIRIFEQEKGDNAKRLKINSITITVKDEKLQAIVEYRELDEQGSYVNENAYGITYVEI